MLDYTDALALRRNVYTSMLNLPVGHFKIDYHHSSRSVILSRPAIPASFA